MEKHMHKLMFNVFNAIMRNMPVIWDGKEAILFMKMNDCSNWKQMEWPGWYFQFMCEKILKKECSFKIPGPSYGKVKFDGLKIFPWDFKTHTLNTANGSKVPTNGYKEVSHAINDYGRIGFIIACGNAQFDDECKSFKNWHDGLKEKVSEYEKQRIDRGAPSRRRKVLFSLENVKFIILNKTILIMSYRIWWINKNQIT